ncbi:MAG: 4Fe-4S binding protein, partial [Clostridiales bacterium]|nr:4Fe-4S binding protein [Clostridiales bacterium]
VVISSVFVLRIFCRILCPLGAIYSLLNPIAILRMKCDKAKCTSCGLCKKSCDLKIEPALQPNSGECFRCGKCKSSCPQKALSYTL